MVSTEAESALLQFAVTACQKPVGGRVLLRAFYDLSAGRKVPNERYFGIVSNVHFGRSILADVCAYVVSYDDQYTELRVFRGVHPFLMRHGESPMAGPKLKTSLKKKLLISVESGYFNDKGSRLKPGSPDRWNFGFRMYPSFRSRIMLPDEAIGLRLYVAGVVAQRVHQTYGPNVKIYQGTEILD